MTASKLAKNTPLPEDVLKDLRDHARTYFKLDLTYIAAIGAILTALKFERPAVFEAIAAYSTFGYALLALVVFDTIVAMWLADDWIDVKCGKGERTHPTFSRVVARIQPLAHATFLIGALIFVVGRSEGFYSLLWVHRAEAELQESVEHFAVVRKRYPISFDELKRADPTVVTVVERLKGERFSYETVGDRDYRLTFNRRELGYSEDRVATHELQLRPILDAVEKTTPLP